MCGVGGLRVFGDGWVMGLVVPGWVGLWAWWSLGLAGGISLRGRDSCARAEFSTLDEFYTAGKFQ